MITQITNKQVKIVSNVNFNNNEIENAIIDYNKNQFINLPDIGGSNKTFDELGIIKITSSDTFIDLAQEIQDLQLPTGTIIFGEVRNNGMPSQIANAEVKVEILDTKTNGSPHYQVLLFTLCSSDVSPYQWIFVYYQPNYDSHHQTWDWIPINGGGGGNIITTWFSSCSISNTTQTSVTNLSVNSRLFTDQLSINGTYTFEYDGVNWNFNGNSVDLDDYGISFEGTPTNNDIIVISLNSIAGYTLSTGISTINTVLINGLEQVPLVHYRVNNGTITFSTPLSISDYVGVR